MKIKQLIPQFFLVSLALFLIQGCVSLAPMSAPNNDTTGAQSSTPFSIVTLTFQPTLDLQSGYTSHPTLPPERENQMAALLKDIDCVLPCYLGITPGSTSIDEALSIMRSLGAFRIEIGDNYAFRLDIGDPIIPPMLPNRYALVYSAIDLTVVNDVVQVLNITITTEKATTSFEIFRDYWKRYSASSIFFELGQPEELYTGQGRKETLNHELIISYEKKGIYIRIRGSWQENNLCPIDDKQEIYVHMVLFDPVSSLSLLEFNPGIGNPSYWPTISDSLGISTVEFYRQVVLDNSICFEIP